MTPFLLYDCRVKIFEMAFESYPQLIIGLFIWQGLQIKEILNFVSISVSAASAVYGMGDLLAFNVVDRKARAPFLLTVYGMFATFVDTLLRAFSMAYAFSIVKAWGLLILPIYFVIMSIAICVKKKKVSINKLDLFGIAMSFGCSAVESEEVDYNLR